MHAVAKFALVLFASLAFATDPVKLTNQIVSVVANPTNGATYTYACGTSTAHILIFTYADVKTAQFEVTSVPKLDNLPVTLSGDTTALPPTNTITTVSCQKDAVITITLKSADLKSMGALVAEQKVKLDFGAPINGPQAKLTGQFLNIVQENGRLFGSVTLTNVAQDSTLLVFVQDSDLAFHQLTPASGVLTVCANANAEKRYIYIVNIAADKDQAFTLSYVKVSSDTQLTTKAPNNAVALVAGQLYEIGSDVKAMTANGNIEVFATCTDYLSATSTKFTVNNIWLPKVGVSQKAPTATFFAVRGNGATVNGLAEDNTPATACPGNSVGLPDSKTCVCPGMYVSPACTEIDATIITQLDNTKPAPGAKKFTYAAADITNFKFLGWKLDIPATANLQITLAVDDTKDFNAAVALDTVNWPASGSSGAANEFFDSFNVAAKQASTVIYCAKAITGTTYFIGLNAAAAVTGTVTIAYYTPDAAAPAPINIGDAPLTLKLTGDATKDTQYICLKDKVNPATQITVQTCSVPDKMTYNADSAKVQVGGFSSSVYEQNGVYVYAKNRADFNIRLKQGYLVPVKLTGKDTEVMLYTTVPTATSFPFQTGLADGNALAFGELSFAEPTKDVANYTVGVKDVRKAPAKAKTSIYFIEKPDFDVNLAKSPCFIIALKDQKEVKSGDKLESVYQTEDAEHTYQLIGFVSDPGQPGATGVTVYQPSELKLEKKEKKKSSSSNKGLIIGLAVGGSLLVIVAIVGGWFLYQRRRVGYSGLS